MGISVSAAPGGRYDTQPTQRFQGSSWCCRSCNIGRNSGSDLIPGPGSISLAIYLGVATAGQQPIKNKKLCIIQLCFPSALYRHCPAVSVHYVIYAQKPCEHTFAGASLHSAQIKARTLKAPGQVFHLVAANLSKVSDEKQRAFTDSKTFFFGGGGPHPRHM